MTPTLVVQGFQRAFVDIAGPTFSVSASMRRNTCEEILKFARTHNWTIIHAYLDIAAVSDGAAVIDGFSPRPGEAYIRQTSLSPFRCASFQTKIDGLKSAPVYLMSLAGVGVIGATFFDALERDIPLQLITNAIADSGRTKLSERKGIAAIDALAGAFSRAVHWPGFINAANETGHNPDAKRTRPGASQFEPLNLRAQDLTALILLAQYLLDQAPPLVSAPVTVSRLLEDVIAELEIGLDRTSKPAIDNECEAQDQFFPRN